MDGWTRGRPATNQSVQPLCMLPRGRTAIVRIELFVFVHHRRRKDVRSFDPPPSCHHDQGKRQMEEEEEEEEGEMARSFSHRDSKSRSARGRATCALNMTAVDAGTADAPVGALVDIFRSSVLIFVGDSHPSLCVL